MWGRQNSRSARIKTSSALARAYVGAPGVSQRSNINLQRSGGEACGGARGPPSAQIKISSALAETYVGAPRLSKPLK